MHDAAVDIILPTFRRPHTIASSIEAVLGQTHRNFTLHVVGDGCDDATAAIVRGVRDPRLRFTRAAKAPGFGYANRNRVLRATAAPFVAYANDDDLWFPDHLAQALEVLEGDRLDLVAFRSAHVEVPDQLDPYFFAFDWRLGSFGILLRNWFIGAGTMVHRRTVFDRIGYWNARLSRFGDREFFNRARAAVASRYVDRITVLRFYAQHWDAHYARFAEAPQRRYLVLLADDTWRAQLQRAVRPGRRGRVVRRRQWADLIRFALRSGPKFARFWYERWRSHLTAAGGATSDLSHERSS